MKTFVGIDLGSTTTKAVLLDEAGEVLGRGITNSRSNYKTAASVASQEAAIDARFVLFRREAETDVPRGENEGRKLKESFVALATVATNFASSSSKIACQARLPRRARSIAS